MSSVVKVMSNWAKGSSRLVMRGWLAREGDWTTYSK